MGESIALTKIRLAQLALAVITKQKTFDQVLTETGLPSWLLLEAVCSIVQRAHTLMQGGSTADCLDGRLCYLHLEKTAGTSLIAFLDDAFEQSVICPATLHEQLVDLAMLTDLKTYKLLHGHFYLGWLQNYGLTYENTNFITLLRHPIQRNISFYRHWMRDQMRRAYPNLLLSIGNSQCVRLSTLDMRRGFATIRDHLESAKEALERFLFVGIHERIDEATPSLCALLCRPVTQRLPELNVSRHEAPNIPQVMMDAMTAECWADIELYEFALSLYERKFALRQPSPEHQRSLRWEESREVSYRMNNALYGAGWWPREGLDSRTPQPFRWSGPGKESWVAFHMDRSRNYRLTVRVVNAIVPALLHTLRVSVNDVQLEAKRSRDSAWGELVTASVPATILGENTPNATICFAVAGTRRYRDVVKDAHPSDDRECGICVSEINLTPIEANDLPIPT